MEWVFILVVGLLMIAVALGGWPVTRFVFTLSARAHIRYEDQGIEERELGPTTRKDAGLRGGLWIGLVERFATSAAVVFGQPGLIAVIVAVKGLGRFKELSTPEASEKFVLGTLTSLTWAALCTELGMVLLRGAFV